MKVSAFLKRAIEEAEEEGGLRSKLLGGAALSGIAASPFAGMIGEDPITKDPYTNKNVKKYTMGQLQRMARPGDVILSTKDKWGRGLWKVPQVLATGTDFYHAEPVYSKRGKGRTSITAGQFGDGSWGNPLATSTARETNPFLDPITKTFKKDDIVLMRPNKRLSPEQQEQFLKNIYARSHAKYDSPTAIKSWLKDIFVPKRSGTSVDTTCSGNVCSTMPAQALADTTKQRVHPSKTPNRTLPADFLRSQSGYSPVGATNKFESVLKNRNLSRMLFRGGLGAGMAGTAYGVSQEPELGAGLAGAIATPMLAQKLYRNKYVAEHPRMTADNAKASVRKIIPHWGDVVSTIGHKEQAANILRKNFLGRTLPAAALGGLGAYGAAKGVSAIADRVMRKFKPSDETSEK